MFKSETPHKYHWRRIIRLQTQYYASCSFRWMTYQTLFLRSFNKYNIYKSPFHLSQETQRTYEIYMNNEHCIQYHSHYYNYFLNVLWIKNRFSILWNCNHIKDAYLNVYVITKNDPKTFRVIYGKGWKKRKQEWTCINLHYLKLSRFRKRRLKGH